MNRMIENSQTRTQNGLLLSENLGLLSEHHKRHSDCDTPGTMGSDKTDFFNDRLRQTEGTGTRCPYPRANRHMTVFVYLNDVAKGGRTRWRWVHEDPSFYSRPGPTDATRIPWVAPDDEKGVLIKPEAGMAVVHFVSTTAEAGGYTDRNAVHEAEDALETKMICQQFVFTHEPVYDALIPGDGRPSEDRAPDLSLKL